MQAQNRLAGRLERRYSRKGQPSSALDSKLFKLLFKSQKPNKGCLDQRKSNSSSDSFDKACITSVEKGTAIAARTISSKGELSIDGNISPALRQGSCTDHYEFKRSPFVPCKLHACLSFVLTPTISLSSMEARGGWCMKDNSFWCSSSPIHPARKVAGWH